MKTLNESSCRTYDKVIEKFEYSKVKLEEELGEAADDLGLVAAARVHIEQYWHFHSYLILGSGP